MPSQREMQREASTSSKIEQSPNLSYNEAWSIVFENGNFTSNELALTGTKGLPTTGKITAVGVGLGVHYGSDGTGSYTTVIRDKETGTIKPLYYVEANNNWYYYDPDNNLWVLTTKPLLFHNGGLGKEIDCKEENWNDRALESAQQSWVAYYSAVLRIEAMERMDFKSYKEQINNAMNWFKEQENKAEGEEKEQYGAMYKYLKDVLGNLESIEKRWEENAVLVPAAVSYRIVKNGEEITLVFGVMLVKNNTTGEFFSPELDLIGDLNKIAQEYARRFGTYARILTANYQSAEFYSPPKEVFWEFVGQLTGVKDIEEFIYNPAWRTAVPAAITIIEYALLIAGVGGVGRIAKGTRARRIFEIMGLGGGGKGPVGALQRGGKILAFNAIVLDPLKQAPKDPLPAIGRAIFGIALWYGAYEFAVGKGLANAPKWIKILGNVGAVGGAVTLDIAVGSKLDGMINSKEINPEALKETINGLIETLGSNTELTGEDYVALQGLLEACILAYIYYKLKVGEKVSSEEIEWMNGVISDARGILESKGIDITPLTELSNALKKMGFSYTDLVPEKTY
ncbi:MAG: hypothetical protein QXL47_02950 [Candidatus Anstonellales archaeon]